MMYDIATRIKVFLKYVECNKRVRMTAQKSGVCAMTVCRWRTTDWWQDLCDNRNRHKGRPTRPSSKPQKARRSTCKVSDVVLAEIKRYYTTCNKFGYQKDVKMQLLQQLGVELSLASVSSKLANLIRKRTSSRLLGTPTSDQVGEFAKKYLGYIEENRIIASIDEMYCSERIVPSHVYVDADSDKACMTVRQLKGGWKQRSLIKSICNDGSMYYEIVQGSVKRERFGQFIQNLHHPPGTVLLLDNCTTHKELTTVYDSKGYVPLFLPPYSPIYQPVESAFSATKRRFRSFYPWPMGVEFALETAVEQTNKAESFVGYFRNTQRRLKSDIKQLGL